MFNFFKKKSENDKKIELCKNFFAEFTNNNIEKQFFNQISYQEEYFSTYNFGEGIVIASIFSVISSFLTYILWKEFSELFSNLWFSIPYFTILVFIVLLIILVKGNEEFSLLFLKNIGASFKINKFVRKYFSDEEKIVTIFKFLKHSNFQRSNLDKLLQEAIHKNFTYSTINALTNHFYNYRKSKIYAQIENKSVEQPTDFLIEQIDQEIQFFSKLKNK